MNRFLARLAVVIVGLFQYAASASAGPLDDFYLQQFGETQQIQLQKALLSVASVTPESAKCGMPLKHGLRRDWNRLEQSTQKVLAKQLARPAYDATVTSSGGHFNIHYLASGTGTPNIALINQYTGLRLTGAADWAVIVAATFEDVYSKYGSLGYQLAPTTAGAPYDIYLDDQASSGNYGLTTDDQPAPSTKYPNAFTSWIELDSSFTNSIYNPSTYTPLQSLQITAAHEYHHAIQYGYNFFFDVWYAEATSTWMEDELYDGVDQNYSYIPAWFNNSTSSLDLAVGSDALTTGAGYGRWIFNRFLSEMHGPAMIRSSWETVGGLASPGNNADIPMVPVLDRLLSSTYNSSLGSDFFGFSKRVYKRDWTTHINETTLIHPYSPTTILNSYPASSTNTLAHYSFAFFKFTPTPTVPTLNITLNKTSGIQTALFKNVGGITSEITASSNGNYSVAGFGSLNVNNDEVVLLEVNTTDVDSHQTSFSTAGTPATVTEPGSTVAATGGGSSGCFIATAAYGSYLHPQVQLLRNFRDEHLLTNAPGRVFVALYYRVSPPLADFIARHQLLRWVTRLLLTPLVVAVVHPAASGAGLALALFMLYRPLRRRYPEPVVSH